MLDIVIFGASEMCIKRANEMLNWNNIKIVGVVDNDRKKEGTIIEKFLRGGEKNILLCCQKNC